MTCENLAQNTNTPRHLNLSFSLEPNSELTDIDNVKLNIVNQLIDTYKHYPNLAEIKLSYYKNQWTATPSFVMWDSACNIRATEDYKNSEFTLYYYCKNAWSKKDKNKQYIATKNQIKISYKNLELDLKERFSFLADSPLAEEFYCFIKKLENPNMLDIPSIFWYGDNNHNFQKQVMEFLGDDLITKLNYVQLKKELACNNTRLKSRVKI